MRTCSLAVLLAAVSSLACALSAQATFNISSVVPDDASHMYLFDVDFGAAPQSVNIDLSIAATGGTSGLSASLIDLDELALNGSGTGQTSGFDTGTGTINLNITTPTYSGVHQFAIEVETDTTNGASPYAGTISSSGLTTGAISQVGQLTWPYLAGYRTLFDRAARLVLENTAAGTFSQDVSLDFGSTTQAATFYIQGISFFSDGTIEVYEIDSGGTEQLLGTLTLNSGTSYSDEANLTTSARTGAVTLRIKIVAASTFYAWTVVVPDSVTVNSSTGGGGGGNGGGCSTSGTGDLSLLALLGLIASLGVGMRLRGARG